MFACFSNKAPQKEIDLQTKPFDNIMLKIRNNVIKFDAIEGEFLLQNQTDIYGTNKYMMENNDKLSQEEADLMNRLNNKTEKINLFRKKIAELDRKLKFMEKMAVQDHEEYLLYEELYSDPIKKFKENNA